MRMRWRHVAIAQIVLLAGMVAVLASMGRSPLCMCGPIALWTGDVTGAENSQQFADAYSFVHVLMGVLLFWLLWLLWRSGSMPARLIAATALAIGWELLEKSEFVIHRYREATISAAYAGDSILNWTGDVVFCVVGFLIAWRVSWKLSALAVIGTEAVLALLVRDGMLLNIIMLVHPIAAIRRWQLGG